MERRRLRVDSRFIRARAPPVAMVGARQPGVSIDVDDQCQIRNRTAAGDPIAIKNGLKPQIPALALISKRRSGEAIRKNDLALFQRRQDPLLDILRARREHQQQLGGRAEVLVRGVQQDAPDLPPDRRASWFGALEYPMTVGAKPRRQHPQLGALPAPIRSFERNEYPVPLTHIDVAQTLVSAAPRLVSALRAVSKIPTPDSRSVIHKVQNLLQIFPRLPLCVLIVRPQQIRGMIRHHHRIIPPFVPIPAQAHDAVLGREQSLNGRRAKRADRLGANRLQLAKKKLAAHLHLIGDRRAIPGCAALYDVADVTVFSRERDALPFVGPFDHLRQKVSGPADERRPLRVLVGPRAFAYKHQSCLLVAGSKDDLVPALTQAAPFAVSYIFGYFCEIFMGCL